VRPDARGLGAARIAFATVFLLRTTVLSGSGTLLGWPEPGWHPVIGPHLPDPIVIALCLLRTGCAILFLVGVRARIAGAMAGICGYLVLAQNPVTYLQSTHLLYQGAILFAFTDAGARFAVRPDRPGASDGLFLARGWLASIYAWAGIAKLRADWLDGRALELLHHDGALRGWLADLVTATATSRAIAACGIAGCELLLGPLLLWKRTRTVGIALAVALHLGIAVAARAEAFSWAMLALLLVYLPTSREDPALWARRSTSASAG
jgi:hypothetical protein